MGEQKSSSSRLGGLGLRKTSIGSGEIVEVQGGHIVRSTGRKDRHSKVCTAKGPRDRRVRLAAHTAIQFYDVQDRLGYDRPSKAVDWLINKAKSAIDELAELPAWNPITTCSAPPNFGEFQQQTCDRHDEDNQQRHDDDELMIVTEQQSLHHDGGSQNQQDSSFLPPSLDSDAIADTIKSFFPMGASAEASSSTMQYPTFSTPEWLSRNSGQNHNQDLKLSLQSFQDPMMLHHHNQSHHTEQPHSQANHILLSGTPLGFDSGWQEHQQQQAVELGRLQRLAAWNAGGGDNASGSGGGGYLFNFPPPQQQLHNQFFSQRGPLQSSITPSVRAWMDPAALATANAMADQASQQQQQQNPQMLPIYPSGIGYSSGFGGFSGFHIPVRIQGDAEEHDGYSDKPSSASSDSHH